MAVDSRVRWMAMAGGGRAGGRQPLGRPLVRLGNGAASASGRTIDEGGAQGEVGMAALAKRQLRVKGLVVNDGGVAVGRGLH